MFYGGLPSPVFVGDLLSPASMDDFQAPVYGPNMNYTALASTEVPVKSPILDVRTAIPPSLVSAILTNS